jgi:GT2 family glycosyltransferase
MKFNNAETGMIADGLSIAIPTYGREQVLVKTLRLVLDLRPGAAEVLVIDQTPQHEPATDAALRAWADQGAIRWLRFSPPSITRAMNTALTHAASPLVLFLDDDVIPAEGLVGAHAGAYADQAVWAVVGQVLQPGQQPLDVPPRGPRDGLRADLEFPFFSTRPACVRNVMAGNLSVRRDKALAAGGFDENFLTVAHRFETEFARRLIRSGGCIRFEPAASIRHLQAARGGTRSFGGHLRTAKPDFAVGDYYFALCEARGLPRLAYFVRRLLRAVYAKFYLMHPWYLPVRIVAEARGLWRAGQLFRRGPQLVHGVDDGEAL